VDQHSDDKTARRSFLQLMGGTLGACCLGLNWSEVAAAAHHASAAATSGSKNFQFLSAAEAADVEAIAAQIIPSDATPGAREAGVVYFIDRALGSFFAQLAEPFRTGLHEFQSSCQQWRTSSTAFAALQGTDQIEFLRTVEHVPFFETVRLMTVIGMFAMPAYGGNRDGIGWKLLGFEDRHVFEPPFGYYDRDYPGFASESSKPT